MKILVTGAAGFIGFHLSRRLLSEGHRVVGLDNLNAYYDPELKKARLEILKIQKGFHWVEGSLEDPALWSGEEWQQGVEGVVNLGAQAGVRYSLDNPMAYLESNILGFGRVLEFCRRKKIGHLVFASSSSVYGLNEKVPFSVQDPVDHPVSLYAATKKSNELMAHSYSHLYGLPATGLRFFTVYGPWGRPDMAYFKFTKAILEGRPIDVFNHGEMWRDFTYVDDVVEGVCRILFRPAKPEPEWKAENPDPSASSAPFRIYNIGNSAPVKISEFLDILEGCLGRKAERIYREIQPGDVVSTSADVSGLEKDFGWKPSTRLGTGLEEFTRWYRGYYHV